MKILKLTVAGFGPFRNQQVIDFKQFNEAGLFTVTGDTGSGKTSLLDAIAFALFGETTGSGQGAGELDGRNAADLRCKACTPDEPTLVELDFCVGNQQFRVRRNPEYQRAGRSREVTEHASVRVFRLRSGEESPVDGLRLSRDANKFIAKQVGLSAEQFRRVVVIPQGRFREVLLSAPSEREELLKQIFGSYVYERFTSGVEDHVTALKGEQTKFEGDFQSLRNSLKAATDQIDGEFADWVNSLPSLDTLDLAEASERASTLAERAKVREQETKCKKDEMFKVHTEAVQALERARSDNQCLEHLKKAEKELLDARKSSSELEGIERELLAARQVEPVAAAMNRELEKRKAHQLAESELQKRKDELEPIRRDLEAAKAALIEAKKLKDKAELDFAQRYPELTTTINRLVRQTKESAQLQGELNALRTEHDQAASEYSKADKAQQQLLEELEHARQLARSGRESLRASRAGLLARELKPGCACPVCGATSHPSPAALAADAMDDGAVERLEAAELDTARRHQIEADEAKRADKRHLELATKLGDKSKSLNQTLGGETMETLNGRIAGLEDEQKRLDNLRGEANKQFTIRSTAVDGLKDEETKATTDQVRATTALDMHRTEWDAAVKELNKAIAALPGIDIAGVEEAKRDKKWIEEADEKIDKCRERIARAEGALKGAETAAGEAAYREIPPLEADEANARQMFDKSSEQHLEWSNRAARFEELRDRCASLCTCFAVHEKKFRPALELQEVITGKNDGPRVSLHRWVLGAFLDEVLAVASQRLSDLTIGRYELRRMEGQLDGRQAAGLNIEVCDSHTGTQRPARTLSGGETFLASLAMALALAEVAGARGRTPLDTVFIDEGFGSLDSETLDVAMEVLQRLRESGRTVGLISHVEEMKRRIPTGIEIVKDRANGTSHVKQPG
jgi:exonuclease SbcC